MEAIIREGKIQVNGRDAIIPSGAERWLLNNPEKSAFVKAEQVLFGSKIWNQATYTRTGWRRAVIGPNGDKTPIVDQRDWGYKSERSTAQIYTDTDIIIGIDWGHGEDGLTVFEYSPDGENLGPYNYRVNPSEQVNNFLRTGSWHKQEE